MEYGALFYFHVIGVGYKNLFLKVYWDQDQDFVIENQVKRMKTIKFTTCKKKKDFEIEEYKRPNFKYLSSHPKSDTQACVFFLV